MKTTMDANKIETGFYEWFRSEAKREVHSNLYYLRQTKCQVGLKAVHYLDSLDQAKRMELLLSLTNKFLIRNHSKIGQIPSAKDKEIWQAFNKKMFEDPECAQVLNPFYTEDAIHKRRGLNVKTLRQEIKRACFPSLGKILKSNSRNLLYESKVKDFVIVTEIELGGWSKISYTHCLLYQHPNSSKREFLFITDFLRWLGIGSLDWEFITNEDIPHAASMLGELTHKFMQGVEKISVEL